MISNWRKWWRQHLFYITGVFSKKSFITSAYSIILTQNTYIRCLKHGRTDVWSKKYKYWKALKDLKAPLKNESNDIISRAFDAKL